MERTAALATNPPRILRERNAPPSHAHCRLAVRIAKTNTTDHTMRCMRNSSGATSRTNLRYSGNNPHNVYAARLYRTPLRARAVDLVSRGSDGGFGCGRHGDEP